MAIALAGVVGEDGPSPTSPSGWRTPVRVPVPTSAAAGERVAQWGGDFLVLERLAGSSEDGSLFAPIKVGPFSEILIPLSADSKSHLATLNAVRKADMGSSP